MCRGVSQTQGDRGEISFVGCTLIAIKLGDIFAAS